ncbi:MAG: penicillin-binding transpeptidase domain-containing protein [Nakamurella sp.]
MNRSIRRGSTAIIVLVVALLVNITYIQVVKSASYRNDPNNKRILYEEASRQRGQITAAGGVVLAQSLGSDDSYRYQRTYPTDPAAYAGLTGYYSLIYGPTRMEAAQDDLLSGNSSDLIVGRVGDFLTGRDPRGGNVELTVVPRVQTAAYQALVDAQVVGTVVAIRPSTGEVLAMASTPGYDPNVLASHNEATQREEYNTLYSPADPSAPSPVVNRALDDTLPPGSTFKLVVAAAALSQGAAYSPQTPLTSAGSITLPGTDGVQLRNYNRASCAGSSSDVTMTVALAHSCNTAFADLGMQLGGDAIRRQAAAFGVDETRFDVGLVDGSKSRGGLVAQGSRLGEMADAAAVAQSAIGQRDVALTPIQTAMIAATIANDGVRMQPYLIARTTAPDLSELSAAVPTVADKNAISPEVAADLTSMMQESEQITLANAGGTPIQGVTIASKTGTAEHGVNPGDTKANPPYVSYSAFAPAEDPQVAVVVFIESGVNVGADSTGGKIAAPIGRQVIAAALQGS